MNLIYNILLQLTLWGIRYNICNSVFKYILPNKIKNKSIIISSYFISTIHAIQISYESINSIYNLLEFTTPELIQIPSNPTIDYLNIFNNIVKTNNMFLGYLIYDIINVIKCYPLLGKTDTIFHHIVFICCSIMGGYTKIFVFIHPCLLVGEISTIFLNNKVLFKILNISNKKLNLINNLLFTLFYFLTRVIIWSISIIYLYINLDYVTNFYILKYTLFIFILSGYILNIYWFKLIIKKIKLELNKLRNNTM